MSVILRPAIGLEKPSLHMLTVAAVAVSTLLAYDVQSPY